MVTHKQKEKKDFVDEHDGVPHSVSCVGHIKFVSGTSVKLHDRYTIYGIPRDCGKSGGQERVDVGGGTVKESSVKFVLGISIRNPRRLLCARE